MPIRDKGNFISKNFSLYKTSHIKICKNAHNYSRVTKYNHKSYILITLILKYKESSSFDKHSSHKFHCLQNRMRRYILTCYKKQVPVSTMASVTWYFPVFLKLLLLTTGHTRGIPSDHVLKTKLVIIPKNI